MNWSLEDTIAAIATAPGAAGLAVIRVSGPRAIEISVGIVRTSEALALAPSHTLHHGWAHASAGEDERLDEVVLAVFRAPRSFTAEDTVEISCHGGTVSARRVLAAVLDAGALLARPGEFTLRAFLHGRIDLARAEAVADVIHAGTTAAHRLALSQLSGGLSRRLAAVEVSVVDALAEVEARVDFAEDVGGVEVPPHVIAAIDRVAGVFDELLDGAAFARAVREGLSVPIVGRPNVGKSSLFNVLLGEERAIVAAAPGTTRDRLSEAVEIAGMSITLSDTAGMRAAVEPVERIGVERAHDLLANSPVAIWVVDASEPLHDLDRAVAARLAGKQVVVALNKHDLPVRVDVGAAAALLDGNRECVAVAAATGTGMSELRSAIARLGGVGEAAAAAVSNPRHIEVLHRSRAALRRASSAGATGQPGEIVAFELRESLMALGEITGGTADDELLDRIFGKFCIGK